MQKYRILIESKSAAEFICGKMKNVELSFYTTSPWLIEKSQIHGFPIFSLEEFLLNEEITRIGRLSYSISEYFSEKIMAGYLGSFLNVNPLFASIQRFLFLVAYKAYLIKKWQDDPPPGYIDIVVGNPELSEVHSFNIFVGRFDNLFSAIATEAKKEGWFACKSIDFKTPEDGKEQLDKMRNLGQSVQERIFSLINMSSNIFRYKLMKKGVKYRDLGRMAGNNKGQAIILRECELLEETAFFLKSYGLNICFDDLNWYNEPLEPKVVELNEVAFQKEALTGCFLIYKDFGFEMDLLQKAALQILMNRLFKALGYAEPLWERIHDHYGSVLNREIGEKKHPVIFLTNGLTSPTERLIYQYARKERIPVFAFEHGITAGLSHLTKYQHRYSGINESDRRIFLTLCAKLQQEELGNGFEKGFVAGTPDVLRKVRFQGLQNLIARFMISLKLGDRIILYATLATQNNMIYGPYGQNDHVYHRVTKKIIQEVFFKIKNTCVLKLYPTNRYLDPDPFTDLVGIPNKTKVIQYFEFRYLRALADIIIVDSALSTLGWAWSIKSPLIFLDLPSNPLLPQVAKDFDNAIFRIDCSKEGWVQKIKEILLMPHDRVKELWMEKASVRKKVEEKYIFGPFGNSGKRAADYVMEETSKWYAEKWTQGS